MDAPEGVDQRDGDHQCRLVPEVDADSACVEQADQAVPAFQGPGPRLPGRADVEQDGNEAEGPKGLGDRPGLDVGRFGRIDRPGLQVPKAGHHDQRRDGRQYVLRDLLEQPLLVGHAEDPAGAEHGEVVGGLPHPAVDELLVGEERVHDDRQRERREQRRHRKPSQCPEHER